MMCNDCRTYSARRRGAAWRRHRQEEDVTYLIFKRTRPRLPKAVRLPHASIASIDGFRTCQRTVVHYRQIATSTRSQAQLRRLPAVPDSVIIKVRLLLCRYSEFHHPDGQMF